MFGVLKEVGLAVAESVVDTMKSDCHKYSRNKKFSEESRDAYRELAGHLEEGQNWIKNARRNNKIEDGVEDEIIMEQEKKVKDDKVEKEWKIFENLLELYILAVEEGDVEAQCDLGRVYWSAHEERGLQKDDKKAAEWFRKAAERGYVNAQVNLGSCYLRGEGVEKDEKEAIKWFRKAAEQGDVDVQFVVGVCYINGVGVEKDEKEAVKWYRRAAEQGNVNAQFAVGACYINGVGVEKDKKEAVKWLEKAAGQGHEEAIKVLEKDFGISH